MIMSLMLRSQARSCLVRRHREIIAVQSIKFLLIKSKVTEF